MKHILQAPITREVARSLSCGDTVLLSGCIYTARDAAHKRMIEALVKDEPLPFNPVDSVIYYAGPSPAADGRPIGACGPTTSYRMDAYAPKLIEHGNTCMIGKGERSAIVIEAMRKFGAVYLAAIGGAGALIASCVTSAEIVAYEDLGAEAVRRLTVKDMPLIVAIDSAGESIYIQGRDAYLATQYKLDTHRS